jgi:hypothetical protein
MFYLYEQLFNIFSIFTLLRYELSICRAIPLDNDFDTR